MNDYTQLGLSRIASQARRDTREIRCPRDGAVMRVLAGILDDDSEMARVAFPNRQRGPRLALSSVDVECPACRRRAEGVLLEARDRDPDQLIFEAVSEQLLNSRDTPRPGPRTGRFGT